MAQSVVEHVRVVEAVLDGPTFRACTRIAEEALEAHRRCVELALPRVDQLLANEDFVRAVHAVQVRTELAAWTTEQSAGLARAVLRSSEFAETAAAAQEYLAGIARSSLLAPSHFSQGIADREQAGSAALEAVPDRNDETACAEKAEEAKWAQLLALAVVVAAVAVATRAGRAHVIVANEAAETARLLWMLYEAYDAGRAESIGVRAAIDALCVVLLLRPRR